MDDGKNVNSGSDQGLAILLQNAKESRALNRDELKSLNQMAKKVAATVRRTGQKWIRKRGRPAWGRIVFGQNRIDLLPAEGTITEFAMALGVKRTSVQQWCDLKDEPLPSWGKKGSRTLRRTEVITWLTATRRYKAKPEYASKGKK